jgi:putative methionine-R-sulfoxide reductase with GAF domain
MTENLVILQNLSKQLTSINPNQDASKLVKEIDKHVQKAYGDIYKIREDKLVYKPFNGDKTGHCC